MKELVKWIITEVTFLILCVVGTVACSCGARELFAEASGNDFLRAILLNLMALVLVLLAIGCALTVILLVIVAVVVDGEIIAEIRLRKKEG